MTHRKMRSTEEIVDYVNERISVLVANPQFHSPNAEALEETLIALDSIRQFAISDKGSTCDSNNRRYFSFLRDRDFGVSTVSGRIPEGTALNDAFERVTAIWGAYLTEYRA